MPTPAPTPTPTGGPKPLPGTDADAAPPVEGEGGATDAETVDASDGAVGPPDPTKVNVSYAAGKNAIVYAFDYTTATFTAQTSTGCPNAEETAVTTDGTVWVTSSDGRELFKWTTGVGCTRVGGTNLNLPIALATAEIAGVEELVGYRGGDYVKVNRTTGAVTMIRTGALGTVRPSGDVTRIGARGYLAAEAAKGSGALASTPTGSSFSGAGAPAFPPL